MPYVTASIIIQLMTVVIPQLGELQREGEAGYAKITQYTRYLTVILAAAQATGTRSSSAARARSTPDPAELVLIIVSLTAGTVLLMWIGELITKRGIGNGISILIFASILVGARSASSPGATAARRRSSSSRSSRSGSSPRSSSSRKASGGSRSSTRSAWSAASMTAGGSTYLPLRVNMAGVIPVIFAAAILAFPPTMAQFFPATRLRQPALPAGQLDLSRVEAV